MAKGSPPPAAGEQREPHDQVEDGAADAPPVSRNEHRPDASGRLGDAMHHAVSSARSASRSLAARRAEITAERRQRSLEPWGHAPVLPTDDAEHQTASATSESETAATAASTAVGAAASTERRFGVPGAPLNQSNQFVIGFQWALGAIVAYWLMTSLGRLSSVWTLLVISLFLALALDPLVRLAERQGLRRGTSVALVFAMAATLIVAFFYSVVPMLFQEVSALNESIPRWLLAQQQTEWFQQLDRQYGIGTQISKQIQSQLTSGSAVIQVFGGVLGAGQALVSGAFSVFTVLVLTLYLLASLPSLQSAIFQLAPRSRRARVRALGDEIIRRIGGYTAGQITIASLNAILSYLLMRILGLPFALVLAVVVGVLGLIPMVGATLGAGIVVTVALFHSWQYALITLAYYMVYQQVENYVIAPKVMSRTVQVPGFIAVLAAIAGAALMGVFGALIAIPVAAAILLIIQEVVLPRQDNA